MSHTLEEVRQLALELPEKERLVLAGARWDTQSPIDDFESEESEPELEAAWSNEIKDRLDESDSGKVDLIPGEIVVERMFARIAAHRKQR